MTNGSQSIEVLFSRHLMINVGNGLIDNRSDGIAAKISVDSRESIDNPLGRALATHDQAAIGQSTVRHKRVNIEIGRQEGVEPLPPIDHQRMVVETVLMIVHKAAVKEERPVLRLSHKGVPLGGHVRCISLYFVHAIYCRNSL